MEDENENVQIGKFLDENTYCNERKHIMINNEINLDFVKDFRMIHEIKKSRKIEEASIWQVKYYLYYLKKYEVNDISATIDYPLLKRTIKVELTEDDIIKIDKILNEIVEVINNLSIPIYENSKKCKKCAFFDLCMV